jgi:ribosomal subunit interface protein
MTFPTITFKYHNNDSHHLEKIVSQKFATLEKYLGDETDIKCAVEFEKVAPRQSGKVYRVEANLWVAGALYHAEETSDSFEKAIDEVRDEIDQEMRRANDKKDSLFKRGGRKLKEMMRWGRQT